MPDLPFELEREIFELVFRTDPKNVDLKTTLCSVARRVQTWIDPLFYEVMTFERDRPAQLFLNLVDSNMKPPAFFSAVKILCLAFYVSATNACRILATCTGIEMLACWVDLSAHPESVTLIKRLPLRRLSLEITHLTRILVPTAGGQGTSAEWLSNLTHLHMVVWDDDPNATEHISTIQRLPHLTHLVLNLGAQALGVQHVASVFSVCPSLRVFVGLTDSFDPLDFDLKKDEYRRVVVQPLLDDFIADWVAPYFGLPDMWSLAEVAIEDRAASRQNRF
ncbi:hypothetical protein C8R46DRAFT_982232 [Mycena filopes]|nr:hypothetical protein C8R46DRAFT_982232 [Mycena filopes]